MSISVDPDERFVRLRELVNLVGLSRTEIYRRIALGRFPRSRPYSSGGMSRFWRLSDIRAWMVNTLTQNED